MATREIIDIIIQERGSVKVVQAIESVGGAADRTERRVSLLQRGLRALGTAFSVAEVIRAVDGYTRMENQLKILGYSQEQVADGMEKLYNIAQKSRAPYEQIVNLYGKMGQAAGELGKNEAELLRFTELTGKALAVQGTSGNAARGVLIQITQAMGEGIVRAQEWNSMVENARPLLLAAARGMEEAGGSVSKLRQIMLDGRLTSEAFFDAVIKGGGQLDEQFARTVPTVMQGLTMIYNSFQRFLGQSGAVAGISYVLGNALAFIAENFAVLANVALVAGATFAAWWGASRILATATAIRSVIMAQTALNIALGATGIWATAAGGAIKLMQSAMWGLNAAMYANPIGIVVAAAVALVGTMYMLRDATITYGNTSASLGSIVAEVWSRIVSAISKVWDAMKALGSVAYSAASNMATAFSGFFTQARDWLNGFLSNWGITLDDIGNFVYNSVNGIIGMYVGMVAAIGPAITEGIPALFRLAMAIAKNIVLDALEFIINSFARGLGAIGDALDNIPGIEGAGDAIRGALSVDFSDLRSDTEGLKNDMNAAGESIARTYKEFAGKDYLGAAADGLGNVKTKLGEVAGGIMDAAAARDAAALQNPIEPVDLGGPTGPGFGDTGGGSGGAKKTKEELDGLDKALKAIEDSTVGALSKLQDEYTALNMALQAGTISQAQYMVKMQELRVKAAEMAFASANVAKAVHDANIAILQLKVDAGTGTFGDAFLLQLNKMTDGVVNFKARAGTVFGEFFTQFADGFANSVGRAIVYSEDLGEALSNVAKEALASLISGLVKLGVQWLINAAIGKGIGAAATAATAAQAAASATMWAPAAALASLATSGANAAGANAAIAGTMAMTKTLAAAGAAFKDGGYVRAPGGPRDDKGLAALSNGEFVTNAKATKQYRPLLEAINAGQSLAGLLPMYRDGGEHTNGGSSPSNAMHSQARRDTSAADKVSKMTAKQDAPNVDVPVTVVYVADPKEALKALQTQEGSRIIWNELEKNPSKVQQLAGTR